MFEKSGLKIKNFAFTLRTSILSVFIFMLVFSVLSVLWIENSYFKSSLNSTAFKLMNQASTILFNEVVENIVTSTERKIRTAAGLIRVGSLHVDNEAEVAAYTYVLNKSSVSLLIKATGWGDTKGNAAITNKQPKDVYITEIVNHTSKGITSTALYYNGSGDVIKKVVIPSSYDPRTRPWYIDARTQGRIVWTEPFLYQLSRQGIIDLKSHGVLGVAAAAPVYDKKNKFIGVFTIGISLDYLYNFISQIKISKNCNIFIVTNDGRSIVYPEVDSQQTAGLKSITSASPWITQSFNEYTKNLISQFSYTYKGKHYLASYKLLPGLFGQHYWLIGIVAPEYDFIGLLLKAHFIVIVVSLFILLVSISLVLKTVSHVIKPIKILVTEADKIKNFELKETPLVRSRIEEINLLGKAIYAMKKSLRSFRKYVPATLVRQLIERGEDAHLGGRRKKLVILFSDIESFTALSENINPNLLMKHLCHYFDVLSKIINTHRGTIDKYIGDSIMAFWGAPLPEAQPVEQAAKAALQCKQQLSILNREWRTKGKPVLFTRFGIHFGEAIIGNIGSTKRLNYTAIGDTINIASRLEGVNKYYGTQIIVSESVYQAIKDKFVLRVVDCVMLKGKTESMRIYELLAEYAEELSFDIRRYCEFFSPAFSYYQQQSWDEAIQRFQECCHIYPEDTLAPLFIKRCEYFKTHPPTADWHGIMKY